MARFNTGNPLGSADPRDRDDNSKNLDLAVNDRVNDQWRDRFSVMRWTYSGIERAFDFAQDSRQTLFDNAQTQRENQFNQDQTRRESEFQDLLTDNGYQELGVYEAGQVIDNLNQVVTVGNYMYRLSPSVDRPYTTSGDWDADRGDFVQIDFVTASQLQNERDQRASADASLQQQIIEAAPIAAAERPIIQWHGQVIENSLTIPPDVNAFSFGPEITIAAGQEVTVSSGSSWTVANGSVQQ